MLKKRLFIVLLFICAGLMTGCGMGSSSSVDGGSGKHSGKKNGRAVNPTEYKCKNEDEYKQFVDLHAILNSSFGWDMPIYDWHFSECKSYPYGYEPRKDYDKPVVVIDVNPLANDEMLGMYAQDAIIFDEYFNAIPEYSRFCEKCDMAYYLTFESMDETIGEVVLDGSNTVDDIKEALAKGFEDINSKYIDIFNEYYEFLDDYNGVMKDGEDNCYFILDTTDFSNSMDRIVKAIDVINERNPLSEEQSGKYSDSRAVMDSIDKSFTIYADSYDGEVLYDGNFSLGYKYAATICYHMLVRYVGTLELGNGIKFYYSVDDKYQRRPGIYFDIKSDEVLTVEDVIEAAYPLYRDIYDRHTECGIAQWCPMRIYIEYPSGTEEGYVMTMQENIDILDYSHDEFAQIIYDGIYEFDTAEYILPDDCYIDAE